jgi:Flp pilus assembly protein TadG
VRGRARGGRLERGSAVVEFALVLPVLLTLCLALVQIGLLARDQLLLVQAARAGSRQAVVDPEDGPVRSAVLQAAPGLDPTRVEVTVDRTGGLGQPVEVTVGYEATIAVPLAGVFFPSEVSLEASTAMRQEFS